MGRSRLATKGNRAGQPDRSFVHAPVSLTAPSGYVEGTACNVSERGIRVRLDDPPALGPVSVKLVGLPTISGEICWRSARKVGVRLKQPLAPDVLLNWIKCHGGAG